jgi:hypothetical protein
LLCNKAPSIPFATTSIHISKKRGLGALKKRERKNNNKIKERGQMSQHKRDFLVVQLLPKIHQSSREVCISSKEQK